MHAKLTALALAFALAGCASSGGGNMLSADAPRALPDTGPVSVAWADPATFTELRRSRNRWDSESGSWLTDLAKYMRKRAEAQLPAGERLELTIVDVDRAGDYEPWHGIQYDDTRIVRDIYPPRMTVQYKRYDASGAVVAEGERKLSDPGFLLGSTPINNSDPLRFEKRLRQYEDRSGVYYGNDPWGDRYGGWASAPLVRTYEVQVAVVYLEFRDARDGQVVWTGSAETDASGERSDRNQALREATAEALGEYPPR